MTIKKFILTTAMLAALGITAACTSENSNTNETDSQNSSYSAQVSTSTSPVSLSDVLDSVTRVTSFTPELDEKIVDFYERIIAEKDKGGILPLSSILSRSSGQESIRLDAELFGSSYHDFVGDCADELSKLRSPKDFILEAEKIASLIDSRENFKADLYKTAVDDALRMIKVDEYSPVGGLRDYGVRSAVFALEVSRVFDLPSTKFRKEVYNRLVDPDVPVKSRYGDIIDRKGEFNLAQRIFTTSRGKIGNAKEVLELGYTELSASMKDFDGVVESIKFDHLQLFAKTHNLDPSSANLDLYEQISSYLGNWFIEGRKKTGAEIPSILNYMQVVGKVCGYSKENIEKDVASVLYGGLSRNFSDVRISDLMERRTKALEFLAETNLSYIKDIATLDREFVSQGFENIKSRVNEGRVKDIYDIRDELVSVVEHINNSVSSSTSDSEAVSSLGEVILEAYDLDVLNAMGERALSRLKDSGHRYAQNALSDLVSYADEADIDATKAVEPYVSALYSKALGYARDNSRVDLVNAYLDDADFVIDRFELLESGSKDFILSLEKEIVEVYTEKTVARVSDRSYDFAESSWDKVKELNFQVFECDRDLGPYTKRLVDATNTNIARRKEMDISSAKDAAFLDYLN